MVVNSVLLRVHRRVAVSLPKGTWKSRVLPSIMKRRIHQALATSHNLQRLNNRRFGPSTTRARVRLAHVHHNYIKRTATTSSSSLTRPATTARILGSQSGYQSPLSKFYNNNNQSSKRLNHGSSTHNHGSNYTFVLAPELVGLEREAKRLHEEHLAALGPFNMAFDAAFDKIEGLRSQEKINILEIGFGSGACIEGIFDYFNNRQQIFKETKSNIYNGNEYNANQSITVRGIDNEPWWYDYCQAKFSRELATKELHLHKIDATQIETLLDLNCGKFDIILFRFVLAHIMNFESVFKYIVRYLLAANSNSFIMIQDGLPPNAYAGVTSHTTLLPHMSNKEEFPMLYEFIHDIVPPVMAGVMRFDVPYVLPQLLHQCGMKKLWENESVFGGVNGTREFNMAVENLASSVTRFKLLGYISESKEQAILREIDYARTLPESRSYVMMPMITTVAKKKEETYA